MTGAQIKADFQDREFEDSIRRVAALTTNFAPLLKRIGVGLVDTTQQRFATGKDPEGNSWKALNPAYAAEKRGPGILREKAMRGGLMGSITFKLQGSMGVAVGSNKKYAAVHQFGAVIKPVRAKALTFRIGKRVIHAKTVTIPSRPYLGFGTEDRRVVVEAVAFTIGELMAPR